MKTSLNRKLLVLASGLALSSLSFSTPSFAYPDPCLEQAIQVCRAYQEQGEITEEEFNSCVNQERAECEALDPYDPPSCIGDPQYGC